MVGEADGNSLWNAATEEDIDGLGDGVAEGYGDTSLPSSEADRIGEVDGDPLYSVT